ncbi:MAG: ATP-binding cassette domain-containing protein, partial [Chloroflexi bacterium]|nr:ATP-binding cassette domain-containing protein [Chloroflexota bacterium]
AGKTTTMRVLTGFTPPTEGTAAIAGYDVVSQSLDARRHIGYLPESVPLYLDMTVTDYLRYMGQLRGMNRKWLDERLPAVIDTVHIGEYRNTLVGKLSKGYRQRVGIAQAIIHDPDVLILDEPTIGIDPIQVVETRKLIKSLGGEHTVIVSTHILPEVSMICERVIIINQGQIVAEDTPENLASRLHGVETVELDVKGPSKDIADAIKAIDGVTDVEHRYNQNGGHTTYVISSEPDFELRSRLASTVVGGGWELLRLQAVGMTLEDIFLQVTTEEQIPETTDAVAEEAQQA